MRNSKEDTEAVKKLIIEKAIEVFSQKGYEATNMQDIADAAGISRGPLYYHFKNKKDLYNYVIDVYINYNLDKYIEIFDQNTPIIKKIEDDLYYCTDQFKTDEYSFFLGLNSNKYNEYNQKLYQLKLDNIKQAIVKGELKADVKPEEIVDLMFVFTRGIRSMIIEKKNIDINSIVKVCIKGIKDNYM